jgi:hypothetical protein
VAGFGLKDAVDLDGRPLTLRVTALAKPFCGDSWTEYETDPPRETDWLDGEALKVNVGVGCGTVRVTVVV